MQQATINYEPYGKRHLLPGAMPFVIGTLLYITAAAPALPEPFRLPALVVGFFFTVGVTIALSALAASYQRSKVAIWRLIFAPSILVLGSYLFHLLIGSPVARFFSVTLVMLLLFGYIMRLDTLKAGDEDALDSALRYNRIIILIGVFSVAVFSFGIRQFVHIPIALTALVMGMILAAVSYEVLLQAGDSIDKKLRIVVSGALAVLGAEVLVGLSFLPTPFMVNSVALLVAYFAAVRASVRILQGDMGTRELRYGLVVAGFLVMLVLSTARWN